MHFHSERIATRKGKTKEEILKQWKDKSDLSCMIGTQTHAVIENYILSGIKPLDISYQKELVAIGFINDFFITERLIPVFTEHIVYNNDIAGQIDLVCKDKESRYYIIDFKTNKSIDKNSYGKKMKGVLNSLNDSNFYHYSLQLSIYKHLILNLNIDIKKIYIVHFLDFGYKFIPCENILESVSFDSIISSSFDL